MKKTSIIALILLLVTVLSSCGSKYEPVPSTEEESKVVMTLTYEDKTYDVKYELYRALFLANRPTVDGGDDSVWSGENKDEYINRINGIILERVSDIYACLHLASKIGEDVYSSEYEDTINEYIRISIEGGENITGHGSYDAYLADLKKNGMNYSVGVLLLRYSLAYDKILNYYIGGDDVLEEDGKLEFTKEDVESFYFGDESVRVLSAFIQEGIRTDAQMEQFRDSMNSVSSDLEVAYYIIGNTSVTASDIIIDGKISGTVFGKHSFDPVYYAEYTEAAFALSTGEVSPVIRLDGMSDSYSDGYYVIYCLEKTQEHFDRCYDSIEAEYKNNKVGEMIDTIKAEMLTTATFTEAGKAIQHAEISMDE